MSHHTGGHTREHVAATVFARVTFPFWLKKFRRAECMKFNWFDFRGDPTSVFNVASCTLILQDVPIIFLQRRLFTHQLEYRPSNTRAMSTHEGPCTC